MRSNRHRRGTPPRPPQTACSDATRDGCSPLPPKAPPHPPAGGTAPTSRGAVFPCPPHAGRVIDDRELGRRPRRRARLARRPQPPLAQRPGERRVGALVAQPLDLLEQSGGPQVRVAAEPQPAVPLERPEPVRPRRLPLP